jgi:hypothetical protein
MEVYYVRAKNVRKYSPSWAMVEAASPESAKNKFVRDHNAEVKKRYANIDPDAWRNDLMTPSQVSVRKTPPIRGDIYSSTKGVTHNEYVSRPRATRASASGGRKTLADKQFEALVEESQRVRMPVLYSNDLYKHDRSILRKWKPRSFIWVVRENGTHLYPLDEGGKPLDARGVKTLVTSVEYHAKAEGQKIYLIKGTDMKPLTPNRAIDLVYGMKWAARVE